MYLGYQNSIAIATFDLVFYNYGVTMEKNLSQHHNKGCPGNRQNELYLWGYKYILSIPLLIYNIIVLTRQRFDCMHNYQNGQA